MAEAEELKAIEAERAKERQRESGGDKKSDNVKSLVATLPQPIKETTPPVMKEHPKLDDTPSTARVL